MSTLTVRGLAKSYGSRAVLRRVDLDVPAGTLTAVLGASGCGKTTLLRIVAGFTPPDAGEVAIDGRLVCGERVDLPPERREIGFVAQDGALFPHLPVAANVGFGLPRRKRRGPAVHAMLDLVGLPGRYADRYPHELSGGEQQRVALARALAPDPSLVLLDEPFTSLDAALRAETRHAVTEALRACGTTARLVTHDQSEALSSARRVAVLRDGVIVQSADPRTLYQAPADPALARFVGDALFLDADVSAGSATCPFGRIPVRPVPRPPTGRSIVMVRPEQVRWQRAKDGPATAPAARSARVTGVTYHGHDAIVHLVLETPRTPIPVDLRTAGHDLPEPGERLHLSVQGPIVAYPAES
jgi:iron(III) transport system ATP-binding protein